MNFSEPSTSSSRKIGQYLFLGILVLHVLAYCKRFYDRQFYTRTNLNQDLLVQFHQYLESAFREENLVEQGVPMVSQCAEALHMSAKYLSDLLKAETSRSATDHISEYLIEKAKTLLLSSNASVGEVS